MNTPSKSVIIDNQSGVDLEEDLFELVFGIVQKYEKQPENTFVNLLLSNDGTIKKFNQQYLGRNEITDVISWQADVPGVPILGDIMIDTNVADKQKEDRMLGEELQILFLHGLLHILGYDHLAAAQEQLMRSKEEKYKKIIKETHTHRER